MLDVAGATPEGRDWLAALPARVRAAGERWGLRLGTPWFGGSCSWVAPATTGAGEDVVLKLSWPHREGAGEGTALRAWGGGAAVRLLAEDPRGDALLLERCVPGTTLREAGLAPEDALLAGASALGALWSAPVPGDGALGRLVEVCADWADVAVHRADRLRPPYDPGLVGLGVRLLGELPGRAAREVVLHGDFNPGNVLAARRRPWLAIDPKPMVGDPAYDAWPLLSQAGDPFAGADATRVMARRSAVLAAALGERPERLAAWSVARAVESALWHAAHGRPDRGAADVGRARVMASVGGL